MDKREGQITSLVRRWSGGDEGAFNLLFDLVYDDLRRIARHHLSLGKRGGTLNTTALVHEAYLKLAGKGNGEWPGRSQFFAFCSKAMRRILIDYARQNSAAKRGGDRIRVTLTPDMAVSDTEITEILALDRALTALEAHDARMARIAECRFFGGLSVHETAEAISTSTRTVEREWARARVYLLQLLSAEQSLEESDGEVPEARGA